MTQPIEKDLWEDWEALRSAEQLDSESEYSDPEDDLEKQYEIQEQRLREEEATVRYGNLVDFLETIPREQWPGWCCGQYWIIEGRKTPSQTGGHQEIAKSQRTSIGAIQVTKTTRDGYDKLQKRQRRTGTRRKQGRPRKTKEQKQNTVQERNRRRRIKYQLNKKKQ